MGSQFPGLRPAYTPASHSESVLTPQLPPANSRLWPHKQGVLPISPQILSFPRARATCIKFSNTHNYMGNCESRWFLLVSSSEHMNSRYVLHLANPEISALSSAWLT